MFTYYLLFLEVDQAIPSGLPNYNLTKATDISPLTDLVPLPLAPTVQEEFPPELKTGRKKIVKTKINSENIKI